VVYLFDRYVILCCSISAVVTLVVVVVLFCFVLFCFVVVLVSSFRAVCRCSKEVKLRPTVSRPVRVGVRHPSGTRDQFFFLLEFFFRRLRVCYFVAPSPTRGWVCNLLLLLVLSSTVPPGLSPTGLKTIFYCPNSWDSPNLEGQVPVFISPRNRVAQIYPRALGSLSLPLTTRRVMVELFYPTSTWDWVFL
jgi:hypothetical protein